MESNGLKPAIVYERFLGFPEDQDIAAQFCDHCDRYIEFPDFPENEPSELRVLSFGTGYGRADFPFIKAYVEHYEKLNSDRLSLFQVDCVDPSRDFQDMLLDTLKDNRYGIFSEVPRITNPSGKHFLAEGKSASGLSAIRVNGHNTCLTEFFQDFSSDAKGTQLPFHCIVAVLSLQFIENLKTTFPLLLDKLCEAGLIIIGETCAQGAWLSKPPPPRLLAGALKNKRWFDLWTDWHKVLRYQGINRGLRLFPPHDFRLLRDTLERSGFRSIIQPQDCEFTWDKKVSSEVFRQVVELIRNGGWKGHVSSLCLADEESGENGERAHKVLEMLQSNEEWRGEWENTKSDIVYENGLRLYVYSKKNALEREYYQQTLQQVVLENSMRTLRRQGLFWYANQQMADDEEERKKQHVLFQQITHSLKQHIEIDNGCFVVTMSVLPNRVPKACMAGSLIPGSRRSISNGRASRFFEGLRIPDDLPKEVTYSRIWLWLYMLYLCSARRPSATAERIRKQFNLEPSFQCIAIMDAQEEDIQFSETGLLLKFRADRFNELRREVWAVINEKMNEKITQLAYWQRDSNVVSAIENFWGQDNPLVKFLIEGHAIPNIFYPSTGTSFEFSENYKEYLFGQKNFDDIQRRIDFFFNTWADDSWPGIFKTLEEMHSRQKLTEEPKIFWQEVLAQFYLQGLFLSEQYVRQIFYTPHVFYVPQGASELASVWGGYHLFMDKMSFEYLSTNDQLSPNDLFYAFMNPFDFLSYQNLVTPELKEPAHKMGGRERQEQFGHEIRGCIETARNTMALYGTLKTWECEIKDNDKVVVCPDLLDGALDYVNFWATPDQTDSGYLRLLPEKKKLSDQLEGILVQGALIALARRSKNTPTEDLAKDREYVKKFKANIVQNIQSDPLTLADSLSPAKKNQILRCLLAIFHNTFRYAIPTGIYNGQRLYPVALWVKRKEAILFRMLNFSDEPYKEKIDQCSTKLLVENILEKYLNGKLEWFKPPIKQDIALNDMQVAFKSDVSSFKHLTLFETCFTTLPTTLFHE